MCVLTPVFVSQFTHRGVAGEQCQCPRGVVALDDQLASPSATSSSIDP
jgi:hypothetical protein